MENRAAVFTSQPQAVEVYERGGWLPASMLGWRHDSDGACSAWVRVEFAGVEEDAWVELTRLRLPESPARHPALTRAPRATGAVAPPADARDAAETEQLPLVRDGGSQPVGRRVPPGGGRRRAPETGQLAAAAPAPLSVVPDETGFVPGRHRAPAEQGRHRAADTAMPAAVPAAAPASAVPAPRAGDLPAVVPAAAPASAVPAPRAGDLPVASPDPWAAPPVRSVLPPAGPVVRPQPAREPDAERVTRPLRLDEGVGPGRRSRRDSLSV